MTGFTPFFGFTFGRGLTYGAYGLTSGATGLSGGSGGLTPISGTLTTALIDSNYSSSLTGPVGMSIDPTSAARLAEYGITFNGTTGAFTATPVVPA
ncbi:MAG: hypothetical protein KGL39_48925 [Patescibacteria group bacterium]|nr:hypothetical protein [Patescibacteria group bacterium]